ncbi:pyridoxamine 5'-phosphate oxidase family protein [Amycolatopsis sp. NPDC058986]|uniref:pyridoxamine 5'-phosphate oxidase family protein n=1 Tax=unclassified Amycolatopsis TaxID=2618356 RepID=UPI0036723737
MTDPSGFEVLGREQCVALLATAPIGRVVFTHRALPAVQPVRFSVRDGAAVFAVPSGSAVFAAMLDTVVAFSADDVDVSGGWFVTALGRAHEVRDPAATAELVALPLTTWIPAPGDRYVRVPLEAVSGRRISAVRP